MLARRLIVVLACAAALLLVVAALRHGGGDSPAANRAGTGTGDQSRETSAPPKPTAREQRLQRALRAGVESAAGLGGEVEAAAMLDDSPEPLVASSEPDGAERYMRLWSISKVATMIALFQRLGWGDRHGETPSNEVLEALSGAMIRSENCRQRRVVLELQRAARGIPETRRALAEEFESIGAELQPGSQVAPPEAICLSFLRRQAEIPEPLGPALLLGTSRWRVTDAARLAHALAVGTFGAALSEQVLDLMRAPKQPSRESEPGELTAPLDWGAGRVFADLSPAYKAGWGGSLNGNFLAGQIVVVPLPRNRHLSLAVMFHPDTQPERDDPGITVAPQAIEVVMQTVRAELGVSASAATTAGTTGLPSD
ncbi:MAG TPA: hypothetical protein VFY75_00570 [Solirubrobacterales bacterium]|nr:hypothetical protein [Solirubrobacterales bacterium]